MSFYHGIICRRCGDVELTKAQYLGQMYDAHKSWVCPQCGGPAQYDDIKYERSINSHFDTVAKQQKTLAGKDFSGLELRVCASMKHGDALLVSSMRPYSGKSMLVQGLLAEAFQKSSPLGYQPEAE